MEKRESAVLTGADERVLPCLHPSVSGRSKDHHYCLNRTWVTSRPGIAITCSCGFSGPFEDDYELAFIAWNRIVRAILTLEKEEGLR